MQRCADAQLRAPCRAGGAVRVPSSRGLTQVRGCGLTSDAFHVTQPEPNGRGAVDAMHASLQQARTSGPPQ